MSSNERIGAELAESFRVTHELGTGPLGDLFTLSEETVGVDVMSMDAGESEHGLTAWDPATGRAVIAVATTPHPMRQRSSIAHELGHVLQGIDAPTAFPGERSPQEIQADSFARHLLLPRAELRNIGRSPSLAQFSEIVRTFGLSPQMAAIQLRTARVLPEEELERYAQWSTRRLAIEFGWFSEYRSLAAQSRTPRTPRRLMARVMQAYHQGLLNAEEAARWYATTPEDLRSQLDGGDPPLEPDDLRIGRPLFG